MALAAINALNGIYIMRVSLIYFLTHFLFSGPFVELKDIYLAAFL